MGCLVVLNGVWVSADTCQVLPQMVTSQIDLQTSLLPPSVPVRLYLRQLQLALDSVENKVHLSGFHACSFCQELQLKDVIKH